MLRPAKLTDDPLVCKVEDPNTIPPLALGEMFPKECVNPVPRVRVPLVKVRSPATRLLVESVTPPAPFSMRAGKVAPDFGMKVCGAAEVNSMVPLPGTMLPPVRKSAMPPAMVRVLDEKSKAPVNPEVKVMDLTNALASTVALSLEVPLKITLSDEPGTASLLQFAAVLQLASGPPPSHTTETPQLVLADVSVQLVQVPAETEAVLPPNEA